MWPIQDRPEAARREGEGKKRPSYFVIAIVTQALPVCLRAWEFDFLYNQALYWGPRLLGLWPTQRTVCSLGLKLSISL